MKTPRVHGIGGVFFKARDPAALSQWYREHLGFDVQEWGGAQFPWQRQDRAGEPAYTVWCPFAHDTKYFEPSHKDFMLNLRVDDLDAMLDKLRAQGVRVFDRREQTEQGRFGYAMDPEGLLLELWEPALDDPALARET
jgi:catechol 2,3-dioxygenase-like lactoylglutathione lyase family enzyme